MNEDLCFNSIIKHFYEELTFKCNLDKSSYQLFGLYKMQKVGIRTLMFRFFLRKCSDDPLQSASTKEMRIMNRKNKILIAFFLSVIIFAPILI